MRNGKYTRTLFASGLMAMTLVACSRETTEQPKAATQTGQNASAAAGDQNRGAGNVVSAASGLQYEVLQEGAGKQPTLNDTVTVNYRGTLTNGKEFDSSYSRGKPATFPVGGVIKGWTEALQLMKEGSKYKLTIPPDLAYGSRGAGGVIGPNETLVFEVELIKVN